MQAHTLVTRIVAPLLLVCASAATASADLRNVEKGDEIPQFRLPTISGEHIGRDALEGRVTVLVYLSAEQRSSELAAIESQKVVEQFGTEDVGLIHVTADVVHKPYYEKFRAEKGIDCPLAFDPSRSFYGDLGLIVFPTTLVTDPEGRLSHVISTRGPDYVNTLDAYIRHAAGLIDEAELAELLKAQPSDIRSPRSLASRHRAAARLLREKGLLEAARKELEAAREIDPEDLDIRLDLADLHLRMGQPEAARAIVDPILEETPDHRRAKFLRGVALYQQDDLRKAEEILLEALVLNPDPARTHYYLGRIYERRDQTSKALEHYREALARLLQEPE